MFSAVIDIIIQQRQPKILVGDPYQQIYSFRGAVNAMDMIPSTTTYYLTQVTRLDSSYSHQNAQYEGMLGVGSRDVGS